MTVKEAIDFFNPILKSVSLSELNSMAVECHGVRDNVLWLEDDREPQVRGFIADVIYMYMFKACYDDEVLDYCNDMSWYIYNGKFSTFERFKNHLIENVMNWQKDYDMKTKNCAVYISNISSCCTD